MSVFRHVIASFTAGAVTLFHKEPLFFYLWYTFIFMIKTTKRPIPAPWSGICTLQLSQGKGSSSALLTCPSACSKICGSFFPEVPVCDNKDFLLQENLTSASEKKPADWFPHLTTNSGLLQQILLHSGPFNGPSFGEANVDVLPKSTGVVIANGFGITKG